MANCSISSVQFVIKLGYLLLDGLFETVPVLLKVRQTETIACFEFRLVIWRLKLFI